MIIARNAFATILLGISLLSTTAASPTTAPSFAQEVAAAAKSADLANLERLANSLGNSWQAGNHEEYFSEALMVASVARSENFRNPRQYLHGHKVAREALARAVAAEDEMPLKTEIRLLLASQEDRKVKSDDQNKWMQERRAAGELWLKAWKRLASEVAATASLDIHDSSNWPWTNVLRTDFAAGTKGDAEYKAALEANSKKAQMLTRAIEAKSLKSEFLPAAEHYIVSLYSEPPMNADEIRSLLNKYVDDSTARSRMVQECTRSAGH